MTTKKIVLEKFDELLPEVLELINKKVKYYLDCGAIDIESYEDNYLLPKIILSAIGHEIAYQYKPIMSKDRKAVKNLENF